MQQKHIRKNQGLSIKRALHQSVRYRDHAEGGSSNRPTSIGGVCLWRRIHQAAMLTISNFENAYRHLHRSHRIGFRVEVGVAESISISTSEPVLVGGAQAERARPDSIVGLDPGTHSMHTSLTGFSQRRKQSRKDNLRREQRGRGGRRYLLKCKL